MGVIRLLLALSVVIAHSSPVLGLRMVGGEVAVQAFFMISGFYMDLVLKDRYPRGSYWLFVTQRGLRLLPVYWVVLLLTLAVSLLLPFKLVPWQQQGALLSLGSAAYLVLANLLVLGQDLALFLGLDPATGSLSWTANFQHTHPQLWTFLLIHPAWSLSLEILFYLVAPWLLRHRTRTLLVVVLASVGLRLLLVSQGFRQDPWSYRFFPTELAFFVIGSLAHRLYQRGATDTLPRWLLASAWAAVVGATVLYSLLPASLLVRVGYYALFAAALPLVFRLTKGWRRDARVGELSYPLYIGHILALFLGTWVADWLGVTATGRGWVLLASCVGLAVLLTQLVAEPVERLRRRRAAARAVVQPAPATVG